MTKQNQISAEPKDEKLIARINSYISYIEKYPLYATLLVLDEYEKAEYYKECAIIRDAITEYQEKHKASFPKDWAFPTNIEAYKSKENQAVLERLNISVGEEAAKEKAKLIKLNLPLKNGL